MINKVCVIAVDKGGPLEIIDDLKDGLFFDRTSEILAKKIKYLYGDVKRKEELSLEAYKKVKIKFDFNTQNEKLYEIIQGMNS